MSFTRRQTPPRRRSSVAGFTLIEVLVVLVIIGVVIAVASLSFGLLGDDRGPERDAQRLAALIDTVREEALMQGRDYGLEFMVAGYRFVELDPLLNQWHEVANDDLLRPRTLDDDEEFELFLEEKRIPLDTEAHKTERNDDEQQRDLTDSYQPHVLIFSSGDVSPFELRIVRQADLAEITLTMSLDGELNVLGPDDEGA